MVLPVTSRCTNIYKILHLILVSCSNLYNPLNLFYCVFIFSLWQLALCIQFQYLDLFSQPSLKSLIDLMHKGKLGPNIDHVIGLHHFSLSVHDCVALIGTPILLTSVYCANNGFRCLDSWFLLFPQCAIFWDIIDYDICLAKMNLKVGIFLMNMN